MCLREREGAWGNRTLVAKHRANIGFKLAQIGTKIASRERVRERAGIVREIERERESKRLGERMQIQDKISLTQICIHVYICVCIYIGIS